MTTNDRDAFMAADDSVTLSDGIVITLHNDPDGYLSAGEDEPVDTEYIGITLEHPTTGEHESIWGVDVLPHQSGHDVRTMLWRDFIAGGYSLLPTLRWAIARETANAADAAARGIVTL